jgi:hypothetical protein
MIYAAPSLIMPVEDARYACDYISAPVTYNRHRSNDSRILHQFDAVCLQIMSLGRTTAGNEITNA